MTSEKNEMLARISARYFKGRKARVTYYDNGKSGYTMGQGKVALKTMAKRYGHGGYPCIVINYPCGCEEVYVDGIFTHCDYCGKCKEVV